MTTNGMREIPITPALPGNRWFTFAERLCHRSADVHVRSGRICEGKASWRAPARRCASFFLACLLSGNLVLGAPSKINPDEQVEFYSTVGCLVKDVNERLIWRLDVHLHVFEFEKRGLGVMLVKGMLGLDDDKLTTEEQKLYRERIRLFMVDNQSYKNVRVNVAGQAYELGPTAGNGQYQGFVSVTADQITPFRQATNGSARVFLSAATNYTGGRIFTGAVELIEPRGYSVISDIDDTIKVSNVLDRDELLKNTFCRPFKPVEGMAAIYQRWARQNQCNFFYVTASPWQLYQPLSAFLKDHKFPAGAFQMREFNFGNTTFFNLFKSPEKYKFTEISGILQRFPQRKFILVGDSGEKDPEIYATIARAHPEAIHCIIIRDVTNEPADALRYRQIFEGIPAEKWRIFKESAELKSLVFP